MPDRLFRFFWGDLVNHWRVWGVWISQRRFIGVSVVSNIKETPDA